MPINRDGGVAHRVLARVRWELKYRHAFLLVPPMLKKHPWFMWFVDRAPWNRR